MKLTKILSDHVSRRRRQLGMTQEELAIASGVTEQYISMLERDKRAGTLDTVDALAKALGVKAWELFKPTAEDRFPRFLGRGRPEKHEGTDSIRVEALLRMWTESEQETLVKLLVALRQLVLKAKSTA